MQLISEKLGQEIGRLPNRLDPAHDPMAIGIDFVGVAESHVLFFGRVKEMVHGDVPDGQEDLSELSQTCDLESWLRFDGISRFGHLRSFNRLHDAHADFHRLAGEVIGKLQEGSWIAAEQMRKGELSQSLRRVLIALTELNESIRKQGWSIQLNESVNCAA